MNYIILRIASTGKYIGSFFNGVYHGEGTLYVDGGRFYGEWEHGKLAKGSFIFDDELTYEGTEQNIRPIYTTDH